MLYMMMKTSSSHDPNLWNTCAVISKGSNSIAIKEERFFFFSLTRKLILQTCFLLSMVGNDSNYNSRSYLIIYPDSSRKWGYLRYSCTKIWLSTKTEEKKVDVRTLSSEFAGSFVNIKLSFIIRRGGV